MESGIYYFRNVITCKLYVGSACQLTYRKNQHVRALNKNKHHSVLFQRAWNKYGETSFEFGILEVIEDKTKLIEREQYYIDILEPEYNICKIAGSALGVKRTEEYLQKQRGKVGYWKGKQKSQEHIQKIIAARVGQKRTEKYCKAQGLRKKGNQNRSKQVAQLDIDDKNIVQIFKSAKEASKILKIWHNSICRTCAGKQPFANGVKFKYVTNV